MVNIFYYLAGILETKADMILNWYVLCVQSYCRSTKHQSIAENTLHVKLSDHLLVCGTNQHLTMYQPLHTVIRGCQRRCELLTQDRVR